jgi:transposase InsO family protein
LGRHQRPNGVIIFIGDCAASNLDFSADTALAGVDYEPARKLSSVATVVRFGNATDLFSRQVVGWSLREAMTSNIVIDALRMAWFKRHPDKHAGLLFHSDWGSQYASGAFRGVLQEYGITSSMSRRGNCWDTACSETLFGSLKVERLHGQRFVSRRHATPRMKPSRGCSGTTKHGCIRRWLMSARCNSKANGLPGKSVHELGYGIRNPGARSQSLLVNQKTGQE